MVQLAQLAEWLEELLEQMAEQVINTGKMVEKGAVCRKARLQPCIELLVLQPTTFCNLDCAYCYLPTRHLKRRMTHNTLQRVARVVCASPYVGERLTIVWHAGEPMVLPIEYYRDAFAIITAAAPPAIRINHSFQTNGLLLEDAWIDFIAEHDIRVGISLDGPQRFHDAYRRTRSGRGTHAQVLSGLKRLQEAGLDFHVITVLTADALTAPDEFFDFYVSHGIRYVGFNIEEIEGPHTTSSLQKSEAREAYAHFMQHIIARIRACPPGTLTCRELTSTFAMIADVEMEPRRNEQVEPLAIVSIDTEGNISTFSPELLGVSHAEYNDFVFGNIYEHDLDDVLSHPAFVRAYAAIQMGVRRCANACVYFDFCRGGAPANKVFENGDFASTETLYCRFTKQTLFEVVLDDLERSLGLTSGITA
jgi:uncharacterized protein